jgi:hypothetical protein
MTGASAWRGRLNSGDENGRELDAGPVLYLTGPMTGASDFNRAAFKSAAGKLLGAGAVVLGSAGPPEPLTAPEWGDWMRAGLRLLLEADGVAVLPGSGGSRAAGIECRLAHDLAMPVRTVPGWLTHLGQEKFMRRLRAGREAGDS